VLPSPQSINYVLILTKKRLGYNLGVFFHKLIWSPRAETKRRKKITEKEKNGKKQNGTNETVRRSNR
jgi:hypothetical protein